MKSYGKFEAVREISQTPYAAIWAARPVGTQGNPVACIKLMLPDAAVFAGKGAAAAEEMLVAAALQQSIANKSEHWAPIYELGYDGNTAFYVTRLYDRTLSKLIASKTKFSSGDLLTVISAIIEGLMDLRSAFGRSHGNLNPSNVLIGGKGRIQREDIRLTDPNAGDQEVPSITRSPDAKALGEMIFSMVTGRPHSSAHWPLDNSVEWDRLGSSGLQWLDLCNDLLNTMARQGPMSLPKIQARLSSIRVTRRRTPRRWFVVAALIGLAACGFVFRAKVLNGVSAGKQWAAGFTQHPVVEKHGPSTDPEPVTRPVVAVVPVGNPHPIPDPPIVPVAPVVPVTQPAPPVATQIPVPAPVPVPVPVVPPVPVPVPASDPLPVVQLPAFLPPTAAAKFLETISRLSTQDTSDQRAKFVAAVNPLDAQYPLTAIRGDRPWQKELAKLVDSMREAELTTAIAALANSLQPDPAKYTKFAVSAQQFDSEAADAEDAINAGASWQPAANQTDIAKTLHDEANLFDDPKVRSAATPAVLDEMRTVENAVATANPTALLGILHDQNSSLPARVAAWQALDLPVMHGHWPASRAEFVAGQKDGDALIGASAGTAINTKTAVIGYQNRRLLAFYESLTTEDAVIDAVTHLAEIENDHPEQRPKWLEYDRIVHSLKATPATPADVDLRHLKALSALPAAVQLSSALDKARNAAASEDPLKGTGPGILNWAARPYSNSGIQGCLYTNETCPPLEFIRVEPGSGKGLPFYMSTTDVPMGLVSAVLADPTQSAPSSTESLAALNPAPAVPTPGTHFWKFSAGKGIELDPASYLRYFRQAPTVDLPIQQITPQAALFIARDLGCRLPTSSEWQAAFALASNPPQGNEPMKGFATVGWKLRDADFMALVERASINQHFPDDGIFLGADPSLIPSGASASAWAPAAVRKMGGWTVADLKNDREGQRQMARLDESSSDFRADLVDPAQMGFRPVGTTHHVFHDLVGNVAEFVLDAATTDVEALPVGTAVVAKNISDWFASGNRVQQVSVIGGSFLSPPELDPMTRLPLPAGVTSPAFADVGFRLAFTDPKAFADVSLVINSAGYLYGTSAVRPVDTTP